MEKYYAFLDSKVHGIATHIRFLSENMGSAKVFAEEQSELNFRRKVGASEGGVDFDPIFKCEKYSPTKHDKLFESEDWSPVIVK